MTDARPRSRLLLDVLAYTAARLVLVAVVTAVILAAGYLLGVQDFPVVVALLFGIVIALPLGIWLFAPLRRRATESIAKLDARRRHDREQLQAKLRGDSAAEDPARDDGGRTDRRGSGE
ncbi:MAG: DUF4229 domain-containing protein [Actinomycetia bacterium]|nr:DUF4229 domain-containing protein [Actinomycetes bacterium]